jgi:hypothetical protein
MKLVVSLLLVVVAALVLSSQIQAQKGKPPKPTSEPATLAFRCAFSTDPFDPCPAGFLPDGVRSDTTTVYTAVLDSLGEASLRLLTGNGRFLCLDFRNGPTRLPGARRHFDTLMLDDVWLHSNVVDSAGNEVDGGLRSLAIGQSSAARLKMVFNTISPTGESIAWAVRFNPEGFPGSDHITVTRLSETAWQLEATPNDRAVLVSGVRKTFLSEGPFYMPFKAVLSLVD